MNAGILRRAGLGAMLTVTLAAAAQCGGGAQACASHGGLRVEVKGIYYCNDGHNVGAGWWLLHHKKAS